MTTLGVGVIGMGWMGTAHGRAYRAVSDRFADKGIRARLVICADDVEARARGAATARVRAMHHQLARGHRAS